MSFMDNDLTTAARSGWAYINGESAREPLKPSGWQSSFCAGTAAHPAILAAVKSGDIKRLNRLLVELAKDRQSAEKHPSSSSERFSD